MLYTTNNKELNKWVDAIHNQEKNYPEMTALEIAQQILTEEHELALRFARLHKVTTEESLTDWVLSDYKKEDFEVLFEYIEKAYSQKIKGFGKLLEIFQFIAKIQEPDNYFFVREETVECEDCEGTGGTYVAGKCESCEGKGRLKQDVTYMGNNLNDFRGDMTDYEEMYVSIETIILESYVECIQRINEDTPDIQKAVKTFEKKKTKPLCKLIGENGNVFNLLSITSKTLKKAGLIKESEEVTERVWGSQSYAEALSIMQEYVEVC